MTEVIRRLFKNTTRPQVFRMLEFEIFRVLPKSRFIHVQGDNEFKPNKVICGNNLC